MTTEEIIQKNKMIAEFMGIKTKKYSDTPTVTRWQYGNSMLFESDLKYHSSWDWLMPVVEKIKSLDFQVDTFSDYTRIEKCRNEVRISELGSNPTFIKLVQRESALEAMYLAVIDFIQWYNDNLKNKQP